MSKIAPPGLHLKLFVDSPEATLRRLGAEEALLEDTGFGIGAVLKLRQGKVERLNRTIVHGERGNAGCRIQVEISRRGTQVNGFHAVAPYQTMAYDCHPENCSFALSKMLSVRGAFSF